MFKTNPCLSALLFWLLLLASAVTGLAQDDILLYGGNQDIENIDPATGENYSINAALAQPCTTRFTFTEAAIPSRTW